MDEKVLESIKKKGEIMRVLFVFLFINFLFADNNINEIVQKQYNSNNLSYSFDKHVDDVVEQFKKPEEKSDGFF